MLQKNSYLFHLEPSCSPLFHPRSDLNFSLSPSFLLSAGKRFQQPIGGACVLTARAVCPTWPCWGNWLSVKLYKCKTEQPEGLTGIICTYTDDLKLWQWLIWASLLYTVMWTREFSQDSMQACKKVHPSLGIKSVNRATDQMHLIRWSWVSMSTSIK